MDKKQNFLSGIQDELKKVTFPTRTATIKLSITVFIISLIVATYLGIIDVFLAKGLEIITKAK